MMALHVRWDWIPGMERSTFISFFAKIVTTDGLTFSATSANALLNCLAMEFCAQPHETMRMKIIKFRFKISTPS